MGIYINGMEIPKPNKNFERVEKILISSSGLVEWVDDNNTLLAEYEAVEFPPHSKWILHNMGFGFTHHCSNCKFEVKEQWIGFYNFCPNCGADMRIYNAED